MRTQQHQLDALLATLRSQLHVSLTPDATPGSYAPADLFGTFRLMATEAAAMDGCASRHAILVTGGGVHRASDVDLLNVDGLGTGVDGESATEVARRLTVITPPSGVRMRAYGVGRFEGVRPEVASTFARGVLMVWRAACSECLVD